ncbi:MAG: hypothetical protein ABIA63_13745 [bacterium]
MINRHFYHINPGYLKANLRISCGLNYFIYLILFLFFTLPCVKNTYSQNPPEAKQKITIKDINGTPRIFGLNIPNDYKSKNAYPLVVWLHGGLVNSKPDKGYEALWFFEKEAEKNGFILAAPTGDRECSWLNQCGIAWIKRVTTYVCSLYNIDSTRIYLAGVSDGGAGCFAYASSDPRPFKGFIALSCHPGVAEAAGYKFVPEKLASSSWYIVSNGRDRLYPLESVRPYFRRLKEAGADLTAKVYPSLDHGLDFGKKEKPSIVEWILRNKRGF